MTEWTDVGAGTTIQHLAKIDIFGNVVKAQVSCCQEKDLTNTEDTLWSQAEIETSGDPGGVHTTTSTDYDFNTSLAASHTDVAGLVTEIGYNAALQPSVATLPTGATASAGFDYGNLSTSTSVSYDDHSTQKTITNTTQYDGWGRVIFTVAPNNAQVNTSYDAMGRVIGRTNPFQSGGAAGPATTMQYDLANRAVITTLPGGDIVRSDYSGSVVTATDQVNRKIKREADGLGRLIKVTEQDSAGSLTQETLYTYNLLDKLTGVNQGGQLRSYKYDAMGRLLFEKIPEQAGTINDGTGTMWSCKYTYTEYGAVATRQDARGVVTTYGYDAMHRQTSISYNTAGASGVAATDNMTFIYDYDSQYGTSAPGQLMRVTMGAVEERYTYDDFSRVSSAIETLGYLKSYTTSYEYNGGSQLSKLIYPSGKEVDVSYDDEGRFRELYGIVSGVTYNLAGQVSGLQMTPSGAVSQSYGYDTNRMQMTTQTATKGATSLMNQTYGYQGSAGQMGAGSTAGNAGQLVSISGTINSTTESAAYTYDNVGRLVTSNQTSNGSSAQRRFDYDRWGNRGAVYDAISGGTLIQNVALAQSGGAPTNRISAVSTVGWYGTYTYDAAGNVTWDGVHSYSSDAENRVVSMDNGATATYKYDHQNRRVSKTVGSISTHYVWQGSQVIAELDPATPIPPWWEPPYQVKSARVDYVYAGGRMVYSRQRTSSTGAWSERYYLSDRLSTRVVLDGSGNVIGRQAHLPFGEDFAESGTQEKHHFTSYERDTEAGADYAINRQYAKSTGRFNRPDPLASSGKKTVPDSWNRYSYAAGDPINMKDPLGLLESPLGPDWGAPCGLFGYIPIEDGWGWGWMASNIACMGPIRLDPQPNPSKPEPESAPTCTVFVKLKKVKGAPGVLFYHAFILTQDNQSGAIFYAGARSSRLDNAGLGGVLVGRTGPFTDRIAFGDTTARIVASFASTLKGTTCDPINQSFTSSSDRINARRYPYDPTDILFGHNSNAYSFTLLDDYGFSMLGLIAQVTAWELLNAIMQPDPLPGWFDAI